jgi:ribokinase
LVLATENLGGMTGRGASLTVVGSANLDLVARAARLPRPGETLTDASFFRAPGGKGANQAVAAARLGADVRFLGAVGADPFAEEALAGMHDAGVDVEVTQNGETGVALIVVAEDGENQIVVAPGANSTVDAVGAGNVLCQLEISVETVKANAAAADWFCLNAAPAKPIDVEPDLLVVNRYEYEVNSQGKIVALTLGEEGAVLMENGREAARATPPTVNAVDGTAAGDAFTGCLVVSHLEGRDWEEALRRACAAGAIAASRRGAQPSLPTAEEVDAILAQSSFQNES